MYNTICNLNYLSFVGVSHNSDLIQILDQTK